MGLGLALCGAPRNDGRGALTTPCSPSTSVTARRLSVTRARLVLSSSVERIAATRRLTRRWPSSGKRRVVEERGEALGDGERGAGAACSRPHDDREILLVTAAESVDQSRGGGVAEHARRPARPRAAARRRGARSRPSARRARRPRAARVEDRGAQRQDRARHARDLLDEADELAPRSVGIGGAADGEAAQAAHAAASRR